MKLFLNACGKREPLQLAVGNPTTQETGLRLLHQPFALIGRDPRTDVPLDHHQVSRRHAYLQVIEGRAFWIDLESRMGTLWKGQPQKFGWLEVERPIQVGPYFIHLLAGDGPTSGDLNPSPLLRINPLTARSHSHALLPDVALEFLNGPSQSTSWPMHRVMSLIGSAGGCKFRLADSSVSPFHCSLLRTPLGLWIVDLLGQDGITVNDTMVRYARLADGDVLKIGRYRMRIKCRFCNQEQAQGSDNDQSMPVRVTLTQRGKVAQGLPVIDGAVNPLRGEPVAESVSVAQSLVPFRTFFSNADIEVFPQAPTYPVAREKGGLTESMLVPLISQFNQMQQQMFDQFQQAMNMLVQMFGTLHRDQMELIREELDQLRELTKEFNALKLELANQTRIQGSTKPGSPVPGLASANEPNPAGGIHVSDPVPGAMALSWDSALGATDPPPMRSGTAPLKTSAPDSVLPPENNGLSQPLSHTYPQAEPPNNSDSHPQTAPDCANPSPGSDHDVMIWLHQRIMTLQHERESRWQKILKLLPGLS